MKKKLLKILALALVLFMLGGNMALIGDESSCTAKAACGVECSISGEDVTCSASSSCVWCSNATYTEVKCCAI